MNDDISTQRSCPRCERSRVTFYTPGGVYENPDEANVNTSLADFLFARSMDEIEIHVGLQCRGGDCNWSNMYKFGGEAIDRAGTVSRGESEQSGQQTNEPDDAERPIDTLERRIDDGVLEGIYKSQEMGRGFGPEVEARKDAFHKVLDMIEEVREEHDVG